MNAGSITMRAKQMNTEMITRAVLRLVFASLGAIAPEILRFLAQNTLTKKSNTNFGSGGLPRL
jgi:hypothetical protein